MNIWEDNDGGEVKKRDYLYDEERIKATSFAMDLIEQRLGRTPRSIIDVGCNRGRLCKMAYHRWGCEVAGVDINSKIIQWCRDTYGFGEFYKVNLNDPTSFVLFEDKQFDVAITRGVLMHIAPSRDRHRIVNDMNRVSNLTVVVEPYAEETTYRHNDYMFDSHVVLDNYTDYGLENMGSDSGDDGLMVFMSK